MKINKEHTQHIAASHDFLVLSFLVDNKISSSVSNLILLAIKYINNLI